MHIPARRFSCSLAVFVLSAAPATVLSGARVVVVDQAGYPRTLPKYTFSSQAADSFRVIDAVTGARVFRGPMQLWQIADGATGKDVYRGDFSAFRNPGTYRITTSHGDTSAVFAIADSVFDAVYRKALKGFYFQRCGTALIPGLAGAYQHPVCHAADGFYHISTDSLAGGFHLTTGGWHDAGDYGKYVVNAGISVGTLLLAYEMFPSRFDADNLGIPESGNGVPDILDEARYEIAWLLTMQRGDGAFWFKVTHEQFEGFVMPQADTSPMRYIFGPSSAATGDAVAVLARATRLFGAFDAGFAATCLASARAGWQYLAGHSGIVPAGGFRNPPGVGTGEYGDGSDADERLWAASEMFETTGEATFNSYFTANVSSGSLFGGTMWWGDVRPLALVTYMRSTRPGASAAVKTSLAQALRNYCTGQTGRRNGSGYHSVLAPGDYVWGCNGGALNAAVLLIAGASEFNDSTFAVVAADQLHYVLGANALSRSFVTGIGENPPRQPHHRPSASDGVADPVPGLLAGGPNQARQDAVLQALFTSSTPPALCYADSLPSYASNEIAINWNAPLVFVAGYFGGKKGALGVNEELRPVPDRFSLGQNYPNPFNGVSEFGFRITESGVVRLQVFDLLGRLVARVVDEPRAAGSYVVAFDASSLASGTYVYRLTAGQFTQSKRMVLIR